MNSVSETCSQLKQTYDACFNAWFGEKFLKGDHSIDACSPMFQVYQECVKVTRLVFSVVNVASHSIES